MKDRLRRAFSLIELLIVITLTAAVLGAAAVGFASLQKLDRRYGGGDEAAVLSAEFVRALRNDAYGAVRFVSDRDAGTWTFARRNGDEVLYQFAAERCVRSVDGGDTPAGVFWFPGGTTWEAAPEEAQGATLLEVTFSRDAPGADPRAPAPRVTEQVNVALGRDVSLGEGATQP